MNRRQIDIVDENGLIECRIAAGNFATESGFDELDRVRITTAVSEIVRNAITHADTSRMELMFDGRALTIVVHDNGPGIPDVETACLDGYSTTGSLGLGLGGSRRLMDDFHVKSSPGTGTTVTMRKHLNGRTTMDGAPTVSPERVGSRVEGCARSY